MIKCAIQLLFCGICIMIVTVRPETVSKQYTQHDSYSGKILNISKAVTYSVASRSVCAVSCGPDGHCFGYHSSSSLCRVYKFCQVTDITGDEAGWAYYEEIVTCPAGWATYDGHCYFRNTTLLSQPEAMATCRSSGAYLVEINDGDENDWIRQTLLKNVSCSDKYNCTSWTGANDRSTEGVFVWEHSGTPVAYTNWDPINPDDWYDPSIPRDCVDLFYNGEWNDKPCEFPAAFICEK